MSVNTQGMVDNFRRDIQPLIGKISGMYQVDAGELMYGNRTYLLHAVITQNSKQMPWIFISAGIHGGDEPAGVFALADFLIKDAPRYTDFVNIMAFPCVNPSGFEKDSRHNKDGLNINRCFTQTGCQESRMVMKFLEDWATYFLFSWDMHEDNSKRPVQGHDIRANPNGFYLYETTSNPTGAHGRRILNTVEAKGVTLFKDPFIYTTPNDRGLILNDTGENQSYIDLENYMFMQRYTDHSFTVETPTCWSLEMRVKAHRYALIAAIDSFIA